MAGPKECGTEYVSGLDQFLTRLMSMKKRQTEKLSRLVDRHAR
jgi:hypothetical protein